MYSEPGLSATLKKGLKMVRNRGAAVRAATPVHLLVVEAGDHHRLVDAVGGERVELAVEQGPPVEVDQALGPVVGAGGRGANPGPRKG